MNRFEMRRNGKNKEDENEDIKGKKNAVQGEEKKEMRRLGNKRITVEEEEKKRKKTCCGIKRK